MTKDDRSSVLNPSLTASITEILLNFRQEKMHSVAHCNTVDVAGWQPRCRSRELHGQRKI